MIVQSQLDGQLYEVPDTYGGLSGYQEYVDPGLGLPFLAALIPKVAAIAGKALPAIAGKALPAVAQAAGSILPGITSIFRPGGGAAPAVPITQGPGGNLSISPQLIDAIARAVQARNPTQPAQPAAPAPVIVPRRRRRRRRNLGEWPGYGYYGYHEYPDYGWPGY